MDFTREAYDAHLLINGATYRPLAAARRLLLSTIITAEDTAIIVRKLTLVEQLLNIHD